MEVLLVGGLTGWFLYNVFAETGRPEPKTGNPKGNELPAPRFLYSDPSIWTAFGADITYLPYESFYGPNNDPRRAYLLYGGSRVVHSGYNPVVQTNRTWPVTLPSQPSSQPGYTAKPIHGTGQKQAITSTTVFTE